MIKLVDIAWTIIVLICSVCLTAESANFKPSSPTADIIYPAAPFLTRRAGVGNETYKSATDGRGCDCVELEIVTTNEAVRRKHGDLLGKYTKMEKIKGFIHYIHKVRLLKKS